MSWEVFNAGTLAATIGAAQVLNENPNNSTFVLAVDTSAMLAGDAITISVYAIADGTNEALQYKASFADAQVDPVKVSPGISVDAGAKFVLEQTAGVARSFPWRLLSS